ncbi:MAG: radical SAM protein, partial [Planctomycetota bacterium]
MFTPKPDWLKVKLPLGRKFIEIKGLVKHLKLATVCEEANCPNMGECWAGGTATFMLLGKVCTRGCRFCNVESGKPQPPDPAEPLNILKAVSSMRLSYVVLTMVTRDDLPDGGAQHIYNTVKTLKDNIKNLAVETLVSDLAGNEQSIKKVLDAEP